MDFLKKKFTLKLIPHKTNKQFVLKFTSINIFLGLLLFFFIFLSVFFVANRELYKSMEKINKLKSFNKYQNEKIKKLKDENSKIIQILDNKTKDLSDKVEKIQKENSKIKKIVGVNITAPMTRPKNNLLSSRGRDRTYFEKKLENLKEKILKTDQETRSLKNKAITYRTKKEREKIAIALSRIPSRWPANGEISSEFGLIMHPIYGGYHFHTGLDIIAPYGSQIYATAAGTVVQAGYMGGYGYSVTIDHNNGWKTLYAHCSELKVSERQTLKKGQLIALIGTSGSATGPHVHYEVFKNDERIDPATCLNKENKYFAQIFKKLNNI